MVNATQQHEVYLFDPHPGLLGCTEPLPESIRLAAESLDGKMAPLSEAVETIRDVAPDGCLIRVYFPEKNDIPEHDFPQQSYGYIAVSSGDVVANIGGAEFREHNWRVISFRELR